MIYFLKKLKRKLNKETFKQILAHVVRVKIINNPNVPEIFSVSLYMSQKSYIHYLQ